MKKLLFGLGLLPLAVLPVLTIVSCGTSSGSGDGGTTNPDTTTDLKITAIPSTQPEIDNAISNFNKSGAADSAKITALSKIFKGITSDNFKNFKTKATATAGSIPGTIVLTANTGFSFGVSSSSLTSSLAKIVDLNITAIPSTQAEIDKVIEDFNNAKTDTAKTTALQTIFKGITTTNYKNFLAKATPTEGTTPGKIVLTTKPGFSFGSSSSLTSVLSIDLKITPIKIAQPIIDKSIEDFNKATTDATKIEALKTTFSGITTTNFKNFEVTATAGTAGTEGTLPGTIVLTAKEGFIFGTSKVLSSKVLGTNLDEQVDKFSTPVETKTKTTLATEAAKSITNAADAPAKLAALKVLVDLPTLSDGFTFEVKSAIVTPTTDTSIDVTIVVTETATSTTKPTIFKVTGLKGAPTLDEEVAKFSTPVETKTPEMLATEATNSIANAADAPAKLAALEVLATLPTLSAGFTFEVKSAIVNTTTPTSIDVTITVIQQATSTTKDTIFMVTGLKATPALVPTLDEEAGKFAIPVEAKNKNTLATEAANSINDATDSIERLNALKVLANLPTLSDGFTFIVTLAKVNTTTDTSINVSIVVIEKSTNTSKDIIFMVTGLKGVPSLDKEAAKFKPTKTLTPSTTTTNAIKSINDPTDVAAKLEALKVLVTLPTLSNEFTFEVKSAIVNTTTPTSIDVSIVVTETAGATGPNTKEVIFTITDLTGDLVITPIPSTQTTVDQAIANFNASGVTDANKIVALQSVFAGITIENFKNFDVVATPTITDGKPGAIVLTAKKGFAINGNRTLASVLLIDLGITAIPSQPTIINEAIVAINAPEATVPNKITALSTIFNGITPENFVHFDVKATPGTGETGTVILTANPGYTINGEKTLSSHSFTAIDLKITVAKGKIITQSEIDKAIVNYRLASTDEERITALSTIFDGITTSNFLLKFDVTATPTITDGKPGTIVLTAKPGFAFGTSETLTSMIVENLEGLAQGITATAVAQSIIDQAIIDFNAPGAKDSAKIEALSKVFKAITPKNFPNFDVQTIPTNELALGKIVLTAKPGFIFGTSETLSSIINLPIFAKPEPVTQQVIEDAIAAQAPGNTEEQKITALQTIFDGITAENFKYFDVKWHGTPGYLDLYLVMTTPEFAFNGEGIIFPEVLPPATTPTIEHENNIK